MSNTLVSAGPGTDPERMHEAAHALTPNTLGALVSWLAQDVRRVEIIDDTLAELGVPEPRYEDGVPVPGSVVHKLLYWSHVAYIVRRLEAGNDVALAAVTV